MQELSMQAFYARALNSIEQCENLLRLKLKKSMQIKFLKQIVEKYQNLFLGFKIISIDSTKT